MATSRDRLPVDLLGALVQELTDVSRDGYCGQTHIHKAAFIGQELLGLPFGLNWEIYHFGPFSRGVLPGLDLCEQEGTVATQRHPNGPRITRPTDAPDIALSADFQEKLQLLARRLAPMNRGQLEKVATAAWVTRFPDGRGTSVESRAAQVHGLKPKIGTPVAARVVEYLDDFIIRAAVPSPPASNPDPDLMRALAARTSELYPPWGTLDAYRPRLRARIVIEVLPTDRQG